MREDPKTEDKELDDWLGELMGDRVGEPTNATRLRQLILNDHRRLEAEFDEVRARRLRSRVLTHVADSTGSRKKSSTRWTRPAALAASVLIVFTAGLLANRMLFENEGLDESEWVLSYGELQRTRGEVEVLRADVARPEDTARSVGLDLAEQTVVFEVIPLEDRTYRLQLYVSDQYALARFNTVLETLELVAESPGYYILTIE